MKKIKNVFLALLLLLMSVALVACNNDAPNVDAGTGGETGGDTDGETGGNTDGETGGDTDGETGGDTDGETGGDTDGETGGDTDGATAQYKIETIADPDLYDIAYYGMIVSEFESAEDADAFADQICSQGGADGYSYMFVSGNVVIEADMTYGASAFECLSDMPDVKVYMKSF